MEKDLKKLDQSCKTEVDELSRSRKQLPEITESIIANCYDSECFTHAHSDHDPIPSEGYIIDVIDKLREILFPGYFSRGKVDAINLKYNIGQTVSVLFDMISEQIAHSIRHECFRYDQPCSDCEEQGQKIALDFLESLPSLRQILTTDVRAIYEGDPAAKSYDEIIFCYPGLFAITVYRIAHKLYEFKVPLLPRIMTEHAHSLTGIDIHPGADIGESFCIDHGTGIVVGETTEIGKDVRIYQGVTLGALSLPKGAGEKLRGKKRHPTIEDDVIIYAGATILGGDTVIGARSVIGGNVWLTESVPADTRVIMETPRLIFRHNQKA